MQPAQAKALGLETRRSPVDTDRFAVDSRRRALDRLRAFLLGGPTGPVLITGEPGAGKSWLVRRVVEGLPVGWHAAGVELTSALDGLELLRLVGDGLGLAMPDRLGAARLMLGAGLRDAAADGRNWLLIVDEAQRASAEAREEVQALSNQLGRAGGFAALVLLGRTELARELATRRRNGWENRLGLHIHLPPLDLDEAREFLGLERRITEQELEALHRDALGNPRAMLRIVEAWSWASQHPAAETHVDGRHAASCGLPRPVPGGRTRSHERPGEEVPPAGIAIPPPAEEATSTRSPSLIPARPPIRLEDGLVEVGWEGDLEAEPTRPEAPHMEPDIGAAFEADPNEEMIEDRYAALQAWAEWSRNRERSPLSSLDPATDPADTAAGKGAELGPTPAGGPQRDSDPSPAPSVRAEMPHDFAPYSPLFTRLRHSS
jgi:general secretion pathway protein A